jgi:ABC-type nitrate/sulfonate/bicarbonate transport system substrate-binding protein
MRYFFYLFAVVRGLAIPLAAFASTAGGACAADKVSFAFSFAGTSAISNYYATQDQGFLKAQGVEAEWVVPANAADSVKLLASGQVQFALANSTEITVARGRGVPIRSVFAGIQYGTAGILAPVEANIRSIKDLEGKTIGITGLPANRSMLLHVLRVNGVGPEKVRLVNVGFGSVPALLAGTVDVLGDSISYAEPIDYNKLKGKPLNDMSTITYFPFYKHGGPQYYVYNIAVADDYLKQNPDVVRRFLKGVREGLKWSVANQEAAVKFYLGHHPEAQPDRALAAFQSVATIVTSPDTEAHGLGWQNPNVWTQVSNFMHEIKATPEKIDSALLFTNDY